MFYLMSVLCSCNVTVVNITKYGRYHIDQTAGHKVMITSSLEGVVISFNSFNCGYFNVSGLDSSTGELKYHKMEYISSDFVGVSMGKLLPEITIGFFVQGYIDFMAYVGFNEKYESLYINTFDKSPFLFTQDSPNYYYRLRPNQQFIVWYPNPNLKSVNVSSFYGGSKGNTITNIDSTGSGTMYRGDFEYTFDSKNGMAAFKYQGLSPIASKIIGFVPITSGNEYFFEYQQVIQYSENPVNIYKFPLPTATPEPSLKPIQLGNYIFMSIVIRCVFWGKIFPIWGILFLKLGNQCF